MSYTSRFCQLKDLIKIHICGKSFISIACAVVEFKIFKVFRIDSASWSGHFFGFSGLTPPNIDRSCWNFDQRLWDFVSNKINTVFERSAEILYFGSNATHPKLTILVHFGSQFTTGKTKNIAKNWNFCGISNPKTPRSQRTDKILVKLSKKKHFWGQYCSLDTIISHQKFSHSL